MPIFGENIIVTLKMRNNFCYPLKMVIFPILLFTLFSLSSLRARKSDNYRDSDNFRERAIKNKQRTDTKKDAKRIKSDNFTRSN